MIRRLLQAEDPRQLLKRFIAVSMLAWLVLLLLIAWGMHQILLDHAVHTIERGTSNLGRLLLQNNRYLLIDPLDGQLRRRLDENLLARLDKSIRGTGSQDILKLKVYAPDGLVVYSTEKSIIGQTDRDNDYLVRALGGQVNSQYVRRGAMIDMEREQRFDVDLLGTYIPIYDDAGKPVGAFEIYNDLTAYRDDIDAAVASTVVIIGLLLLVSFILQSIMMVWGTSQLNVVQQDLKVVAQRDSLTGLFNRRYLDKYLVDTYAQLNDPDAKEERAIGILMIDLDHFKRINDDNGHIIGDKVLIITTGRILKSMRTGDVVSRYGGEEFVVVLPDTDIRNTVSAAKRIWTAIREKPVEIDDHGYNITVSIGATCMTLHDGNPWTAIQRADEALYDAKQSGRDQIKIKIDTGSGSYTDALVDKS